jgi:hypothetical protein
MMTQETYVNINDLHKQGWTIAEIAAETGWHRTTVSRHLKNGPPPLARPTEATVMTDGWRSKIDALLEVHPRLLSISVHNKLNADGFDGSYPTVVRAVRVNRGPRFKAANAVSVPIYTAPGDEAQFDFCDLSSWAVRFGWNIPLVAFGMILSWSRFRLDTFAGRGAVPLTQQSPLNVPNIHQPCVFNGLDSGGDVAASPRVPCTWGVCRPSDTLVSTRVSSCGRLHASVVVMRGSVAFLFGDVGASAILEP